MPANGRVNHDFVALHSMWIIFVKGICVLERVEIIHKSTVPGKNFDSYTLQKNYPHRVKCHKIIMIYPQNFH